MDRNRGGRPRHPDVLTPAEWRVLEALRDGGTNAAIGARLGLRLDTVKYHISNMLAKLELRDRRELASWRPDAQRGRLGAVLAVPAVVWSVVGRPLVWVGMGAAAVAGAAVAVVAAVGVVFVVLVVVAGEGDESLVATPPVAATAQDTSGPTATSTVPRVTATAQGTAGPMATSTAPPTAGSAVTASPVPGLCTTPTDPTCIRSVYLGAPDDYAQVSEIPAGVLLTPGSDGRYVVERGQQVTVVTAAPLPADWTRFYLQRTPLGTPSPLSHEQLIQPVGTTYTFTVTDDERGASVVTFDLTAARPHPVRPTHKPVLGDVVVTTEFLVPTLRYNLLDTTGAATGLGTYAFLQTAGDVSSAINNFGLYPSRGVELRIHPTDASGVSQASFYATLEVGDTFDYRTNGLDCSFRFKVESVPTATSIPLTYRIDYVYEYGGRCGAFVDDPTAPRDVEFAWLVPPGTPGDDGVRAFIPGEPTGKGTYRLTPDSPYVVDVPAGLRIIASPEYLSYSSSDPLLTGAVTLHDAETRARLQIDPGTGRVFNRDVSTQLDVVEQSIRLAD